MCVVFVIFTLEFVRKTPKEIKINAEKTANITTTKK